jgi:tetratricopeptide (TPR) repeat protein
MPSRPAPTRSACSAHTSRDRSWRWRIACLAVGVVCGAVRASAEEPAEEFLRAAQDRGYGEVAVEYLEWLSAQKRLPKSLAETLDLELSRSYRIAVSESFNPAEAEARLAKAQAHLDKFLKEHPNHPEVPRAMDSWGEIALDRALSRIRQAGATKDSAQKEKYFVAARPDLAEARTRFAEATARYLERFAQLRQETSAEANPRSKASAPTARKRQAEQAVREAELDWLEARFKSAKVDYYLGLTYGDVTSPDRKQALEKAAQGFDVIFQDYRESLAGLHAHTWHGRAADALGNDQLALDIFDEVLATSPDGRERETGLEPLFAQVEYYRMLVLARAKGAEAVLDEAVPWLKLHTNWKRFDGYQGVALEVAKAQVKQAAASGKDKKTAGVQAALTTLAEIGRVRGEHQQEAILLRREHTKTAAHDPATVKTFDEAVALGEEAMESQDWSTAVADFSRAMQLGTSAKDAKRAADVVQRMDQARYQLAASQYAAGKFDEALAAVEAIEREHPDGPLAAQASSLAVSATLALVPRASDKQAALARLQAIAEHTISRWPDKAEADDARIALGQAALLRGELPAAIDVFERVNPRSQRYPAALFLAAQTHWRLYLSARTKAADGSAPGGAEQERAKTESQLRVSLEAQRKESDTGKINSRQLTETQLLLAEVLFDAGRFSDAAELAAPLVDTIRSEKPAQLDNVMLRTFLAAGRAEVASDRLADAVATTKLLIETGADDAAVNGVLVSLVRALGDRWKMAEAATIEARTASEASAVATAAATTAECKAALGPLLDGAVARRQHSLLGMIYLADTCAQLGKTDAARELYRAILAQAEQDATFQKTNGAALTRIQAQLVGLLRQKGEFAEGLVQVEKLIEKYPNALEPKMEKGRLLQAWTDTDPARFSEAVAHWTMLRTRMAKMLKKPPEYYEVVYNAAFCLFTESLKKQEPEKALQAEQLLNATLVLSPKLSGPEMVAKYKELLQRTRRLQSKPATAAAGR